VILRCVYARFFYEFILRTEKNTYLSLCNHIENNELDRIKEILQKRINFNYKLDVDIAIEQYSLYTIQSFSQEQLSNIQNNALILTNDNQVYFIKFGTLEMDLEMPKILSINDRKNIEQSTSMSPILIKCKEFIREILLQINIDQKIILNAKDWY
jgi:hypothetical protein